MYELTLERGAWYVRCEVTIYLGMTGAMDHIFGEFFLADGFCRSIRKAGRRTLTTFAAKQCSLTEENF